MGTIRILPPEIVSKIAAGEVIERPASVVKETLENALDAGATAIRVEAVQAGKKLIRITDNGSGIEADDIRAVFSRHATSKIASLDDLYRIRSLGFRGEALYSIAAIADVTLRSKTEAAQTGTEVHVRGGEELSAQPLAMQRGTDLEVKELFFNTPARRKFLKADATELGQIVQAFTPYCLLHPPVSFTLIHNGALLYELKAQKDPLRRFAETMNIKPQFLIESAAKIRSCDVSLLLILGDMNVHKATRSAQFVFVNGRPVYHKGILYQINRAYRMLLPEGNHPVFAAFIRMPAENVDVNVHPAKREVKLKDEREIAESLRELCEHTLLNASRAKQAQASIIPLGTMAPKRRDPNASPLKLYPVPEQPAAAEADEPEELFAHGTAHSLASNLSAQLRAAAFIGTFKNKLLLFEGPRGLLCIDQHAAHERINYEKILQQVTEGKVETQKLLTPILLPLTKQELIQWEKIQAGLEKLGFSASLWKDDTLAIHAHPQAIFDATAALRSCLADDPKEPALDTDTLARRACRRSVMFGDALDRAQAERLRSDLLACRDPFTCPHGRPTVVELSETFLEKQFLR